MSDLNMNMSWNEIAKNFQPLGLHLANEADITLPRAHYAASARSSSISRESEYGSQRGRAGTADPFEEGIDLGLNLGDDLGDLGDISVEFGREAGVERAPSVASGMRIGGRASSVLTDRTARSATAELGGSVLGAGELLAASRGDLELELEAPGDLGLDLGEGFDLPPLEDDVPMDVDMPEAQGFEGIAEEEAEIQARARRECKYHESMSFDTCTNLFLSHQLLPCHRHRLRFKNQLWRTSLLEQPTGSLIWLKQERRPLPLMLRGRLDPRSKSGSLRHLTRISNWRRLKSEAPPGEILARFSERWVKLIRRP